MNIQKAFTLFLARPGISEFTRSKYFYRLRPFVAMHGQKTAAAVEVTLEDLLAFVDPDLAIIQAFNSERATAATVARSNPKVNNG